MKNITNADKIAENHIAGVQRLVKLDIVIEGKIIKHFKHFRLVQSVRKHHNFELTLAHDSLGGLQNHDLQDAQSFFGKTFDCSFQIQRC